MRHYLIVNRNHTIVWIGDFATDDKAWAAFRKVTKVPDHVTTEELINSPNTKGRYGLRMVSWKL